MMHPQSGSVYTKTDFEEIRRLLSGFQMQLRAEILQSRDRYRPEELAEVAAVTEADTIYRIDRITEEGVLAWFDTHWPEKWPAELVMEGLEDDEIRIVPSRAADQVPGLKIIIDPIDGTRGLIHDKRPAWILSGVAPHRGDATHLGDLRVAVMTEIPTTRQWRSDQVSAIRGGGPAGVRAEAHDLIRDRIEAVRLRPSRALDFAHGFASFARYLPEGKALLAGFEEALWRDMADDAGELPPVFEDQYISSGGQLYELMVGHDRMVGDLRPLAFRKLGLGDGLVCHPYDVCTALILEELGGVVVQPDGSSLGAPLNTTHPVAWIGFANRDLAAGTLPAIQELLPRFFG